MNQLKLYFPSQPEIKANTLHYQESKVIAHALSKDVSLFYQFKTRKDSITSLSLIPDGCIDILFCCSGKFPAAFLWTSPFQRREQPSLLVDCEYFGIRFFPEQNVIKFNYPMRELLDKQIPLFDVLSADSSIIERIAAGETFEQRIKIFTNFLRDTQFSRNYDQKIIDYTIQAIYTTKGILNFQHLSKEIGYSEQYIRRKFEEYIGFSPKQFAQVIRFQNSLDAFLENDTSSLLDIIHENGYYDQAHFIRGYKKMINLTPKQYKELFHSRH